MQTTGLRQQGWQRLAAAALAVLVAGIGLGVGAAPSASAMSSDEQSMFDLTNGGRSDAGIGPFQYDAAASNVARAWAQQMSSSATLSHNPNLTSQISSQVTNQWTRIGENVGYGGSTQGLQSAFMASSGHKANILGDYNRVGIGSVRDGSGTLWVVLDFVKGPALPVTPPGSPFGNIDLVWREPGLLGVSGWAIDPDTTAPIQVHMYVDGIFYAMTTADGSRPDVGAAFPGYGNAHGYSKEFGIGGGWHQICVYGINAAGGGTNAALRCIATYVNVNPVGSLDGSTRAPGGVNVFGWDVDPDTASSLDTHFYVDGVLTVIRLASDQRPDVGAALPGYGSAHGYNTFVPMGDGYHTLCAYGINKAGAGTNSLLGCRAVNNTGLPFGNLESVTSSSGIRVKGWALDPNTVNAIPVVVYVDGLWAGSFTANGSRPDVGAAYPGFGSGHGFDVTLPWGKGVHSVCTYAVNTPAGSNPVLGCRNVTI